MCTHKHVSHIFKFVKTRLNRSKNRSCYCYCWCCSCWFDFIHLVKSVNHDFSQCSNILIYQALAGVRMYKHKCAHDVYSIHHDRYVIILILFGISWDFVGFAISDGNVRNAKMIPNIERFIGSVLFLLKIPAAAATTTNLPASFDTVWITLKQSQFCVLSISNFGIVGMRL